MEQVTSEDVKAMSEIFRDLEPENITESIQDSLQKGNKVSYTEIAKKYQPTELTNEKIKELQDLYFPLFGKDPNITAADRKARSKARGHLKEALEKRKEAALEKNLKPKVVIQEEKNEYFPDQYANEPDVKEKYIQDIKRLTSDIPDEELENASVPELQQLLGDLMNQGLSQDDEMYVNGFYRLLLGTASIADAQNYTDQNYGISFKGVYELHQKNEQELKQICAEILQESPEIKKYLSPTNRLALIMAQMYGTCAFSNLKKTIPLNSGGISINTEQK